MWAGMWCVQRLCGCGLSGEDHSVVIAVDEVIEHSQALCSMIFYTYSKILYIIMLVFQFIEDFRVITNMLLLILYRASII